MLEYLGVDDGVCYVVLFSWIIFQKCHYFM